MPFLNAVVSLGLPAQVEQIVDVVELVVGLLDVILKAFQLEIDLEPLLAANIALRFLVFLSRVAFLSQLREFVNDGSRKDLENDLLSEDDICNFGDYLNVEHHVSVVNAHSAKKSRSAFKALVYQHEEALEESLAGGTITAIVSVRSTVNVDTVDIVEDH